MPAGDQLGVTYEKVPDAAFAGDSVGVTYEKVPDGTFGGLLGARQDDEATYYTESLDWFRVIFSPRVALRSMPSAQARTVGCLKVGEVFGAEELMDGWARLARRELPFRTTEEQQEAWVLIDGTSRGLGPLLQPLEDQREAVRLAAGDMARLREGMCVFINLDRRLDRRRSMESLAAPHNWLRTAMMRLPAVDGRSLSWPELLEEGLFSQEACNDSLRAERDGVATLANWNKEFSAHLTMGGCGCALSHRRAWRALVNSDSPWALVLEDDLTQVCRDFDAELDRVLEALPEDWDVCYLGFHTGLHAGRVLAPGARFVGPPQVLMKGHGWLPGLYGYLITRSFAKFLLQEAFPMYAQVDTVMGFILTHRGHGYAVPPAEFLLYSPPTEASRDTDIQTFPDDMK
mmetsp:Transcript_47949/g.138784  ORF Transcript_47949/g.138784 Transcript_47949/m.138784 type:complete len:402 (+) Transcript_47949:122-1327(+)